MLTSLIAFIVVIGVLVTIHEFGHYLAARSVGVRVEKFYIGFNLFGYGFKKVINGTEYGIGWLPLGGYVKLAGMLDESFDTKQTDDPEDFHHQPVWAKIWIMSAGVIMNILLAILLFSIISFKVGVTEPISDEPIIGGIIENYPAYNLGLKKDDVILNIDNQKINSWKDIQLSVNSNPNSTVSIKWLNNTIVRDSIITIGESIELNRNDYKIDTIGVIGILPQSKHREIGVFESIKLGYQNTENTFSDITFTIYALIKGNISMDLLAGPIGIAGVAGQAANIGFLALLYLMAALSVNLAFINILPIPGLDGGHVFITLIEGLLGRELSVNLKIRIQQAGVLIILFLFIIVMFNDISRLFS